jgi:3-hydroxyisobutyrate dehydrogenase-like beta-hydroxyacid dehydrogenase
MTAKIAFIGLGHMGTPIAARLIHGGHHVTVWDRSSDAVAAVVREGATAASSAAGAVAGVDVAITMVANPAAVEDVVFGPNGLAAGMTPGQLYVDMSTVGPDAFRSVASRLPAGVTAADAPVRGSVPEATAGTLHVFVGASEQDFERLRPILEALGDVHHVGAPGSGQAMKLVANLTLGASIVAFGEGLALGRALGLERDVVLDALADSPIGLEVRAKRANVEAGRYPANFKLSLMYKDMGLIDDVADRAGIELQLANAVTRTLKRGMDRGEADLDFSAIVATILGERAEA